MTTVVGLYPSLVDAQQTITDLVVAGFDRRAVSLIMGTERTVASGPEGSGAVVVDDGAGRTITCASGERRRVLVAGPLAGADESSLAGGAEWAVGDALRDAGLGPFAANGLVEAICAGAILVAVRCEDRRVRMARDILDSTALSEIPSPLPTGTTGTGMREGRRSSSPIG